MNESDLENHLIALFESLEDARDEQQEDNDDAALADIARDLADDLDEIKSVESFEDSMLLTPNRGLVITTANGDKFQITIVQTKVGRK